MRSEPLKHWISIQEQSEVQDEAGQPELVWVEIPNGKVRAAINDVSGREFLAAQAGQSEVNTKIRIRYLDGIKADMRIVHGAEIYNIVAPLDQAGDKKWLLLMCKSEQ